MDCLFEILATMAILLLAGGGWLFWFYKRKIKRWYALSVAESLHAFPGRITMRRLEPFVWHKGDRGPQRVTAFREIGFEPLAGYSVHELPCTRIFLLTQAATGLIGMVNESQELGTWSDVAFFRKGQTQPVLASSILKEAHFFLLPGDPKIHRADASPTDLCTAVRQALGREEQVESVTAENFPTLFEKAFAEATDARLLTDLEDYELRKLLRDKGCLGEEITDEKEFTLIKQLLPRALENQLRIACGAQFVREAALSAWDWQQSRDRLLIVHDRTPVWGLAERFLYGAFQTKEMRKLLRSIRAATASPRETFAKLNSRLPAPQRYKKLGEVSRPVPADIYRGPLESLPT